MQDPLGDAEYGFRGPPELGGRLLARELVEGDSDVGRVASGASSAPCSWAGMTAAGRAGGRGKAAETATAWRRMTGAVTAVMVQWATCTMTLEVALKVSSMNGGALPVESRTEVEAIGAAGSGRADMLFGVMEAAIGVQRSLWVFCIGGLAKVWMQLGPRFAVMVGPSLVAPSRSAPSGST